VGGFFPFLGGFFYIFCWDAQRKCKKYEINSLREFISCAIDYMRSRNPNIRAYNRSNWDLFWDRIVFWHDFIIPINTIYPFIVDRVNPPPFPFIGALLSLPFLGSFLGIFVKNRDFWGPFLGSFFGGACWGDFASSNRYAICILSYFSSIGGSYGEKKRVKVAAPKRGLRRPLLPLYSFLFRC